MEGKCTGNEMDCSDWDDECKVGVCDRETKSGAFAPLFVLG